jgi:hypothetical protein
MFPTSSFLTAATLSLFCLAATPLRNIHTNDLAAPGGPPRVQLAGAASGDVSRKTLLADPKIQLSGCVPTARVIAFSFVYKAADGNKVTHRTREQRLSEQMIKALKSMPLGSTFTITDLDVVDEKNTAYKLPDAVFLVRA